MALIWQVKPVTDEATDDVAFLFERDEVRAEILRILKTLCEQADPRNPKKSAGLIVDEIEHDSPGWFRVKVPRYAIRIVFRLLIVQSNVIIEIKRNEPIPNDADEKHIEIMQAAYRDDAYGKELQRRYHKYHLEEPEEPDEA